MKQIVNSPGSPNPALPRISNNFWRNIRSDRDVLITLICLLSLFCGVLSLGVVSTALAKLRWGFIGFLAFRALPYCNNRVYKTVTSAHRWLLVFFVFATLSCAWSIYMVYSVERLASLGMLLLAMFIGVWGWMQKPGRVLIAADALFVIIIFVSTLSFRVSGDGEADSTTGQSAGQSSEQSAERAGGAFGKATGAGLFAALSIPVLIWKMQYSKGLTKRIAQICLCIQAYLLIFAASRAALLATAISLPLLMWSSYPKLRPIFMAGAVLIGGFLAIGAVGPDMLPQFIMRTHNINNLGGRLPRMKALFHCWTKDPIIGYGYGVARLLIARDEEAAEIFIEGTPSLNKKIVKSIRAAAALENPKMMEMQTHSDHLERLAETGIIGYIPFAAFLLSILACAPRALGRPPGQANDLVRSLMATAFMVFVDTFSHSGLLAVGNGVAPLTWFCFVLLLSADRQADMAAQNLAVLNGSIQLPAQGSPRPFAKNARRLRPTIGRRIEGDSPQNPESAAAPAPTVVPPSPENS